MKPWLVFSGDRYYPCGGWADFRGKFETQEAALEFVYGPNFGTPDWWHIVNVNTSEIVTHKE